MADSSASKPPAGSSSNAQDAKMPTGPVAQGSGIAAMKALSTSNSGVLSSTMGSPKLATEDPAQLEPKLKAIVEKMLAVKGNRQQKQILLKEDEIKMVLNEVRECFMAEPMLLPVQPPVRICGDIHGQYYDLLRIFDRCGLPSNQPYLFLGDYVDRGKHSVETIVLLYAFKVLYPQKVWLLRGNHECASINKMYGFYDDVKRRYNVRLFKQFTEVFNCMPVAASISEKILCMHGGLSPELKSLQQINQIQRPCDVPERGILCDLLWADPEEDIVGYHDSDRGVSYLFGEDVVGDFLDEVDMDLIVRAHQVMDRGYAFFASRQLVTLFSAPCYCGEFDNAAAVMTIDEKLQCSFIIIPAKLV